LGPMFHCHCARCRKAHGSVWATYVAAPAAGFGIVRGGPLVASWHASPAVARRLCSRCGSVLPPVADGPRVALPAGLLDDDPGVRPTAHIFTASAVPWATPGDDLPRFPGGRRASTCPCCRIRRPRRPRRGTPSARCAAAAPAAGSATG